MQGEIIRGLSSDQFVTKVRENGNVVTNWPFRRMVNVVDTGMFYDPIEVIQANDFERPYALGRISTERNLTMLKLRKKHNPNMPLADEIDYYLHLKMDSPEETAAWNQMDGIAVAAQVEIVPYDNWSTNTRVAQIKHVLAIEQPITTQDSTGNFPYGYAGQNVGYIQGSVRKDTPPSIDFAAELNLHLGTKPAKVKGFYRDKDLDSHLIWPINTGLQKGQALRTRVRRNPKQPNSFTIKELPVVWLNGH